MADVSGKRAVGPAIGVDVGGTRIKAGRVDETGRVEARSVIEVGDARTEEDIVARIAAVVGNLDAGGALPIGLAAAGVIDPIAGCVLESPNFPSWGHFALADRVGAATGRPVSLENDANAVVFGEAIAGAGRGAANVLGYTLGTGVGGGLVLGGHIWRGERGMAGELGHVTVEPDGRTCGCGNRGCLEQYAGQVGIRRTMRERGGAMATLAEHASAPARLAELARGGDADAQAIFQSVGGYLGMAVAALIHTLDVTTILLCGGIAAAAPLFVPAMEAELRARTFRSMSAGVQILVGTLGADAGIVGAAAIASGANG
ncbi:MAG: ROK family protein [Deltaproteobacteria bacterium]|nr:MAG: ROK family protein [Deltaproteobacteria bacterium]